MKQRARIHTMVITALLIAIGTIIPMISPVKIVIPPMSFTLASHVAIMVAIFISPSAAVAVALGTTLGFLMAGFPMPVVLRALSHVIWAYGGAYYLKKHPETLTSVPKTLLFNLAIALVHAVAEVIIVLPVYFGTVDMGQFYYMIFGLIGFGTIVHSSVDFVISIGVWQVLSKNVSIAALANVKKVKFRKLASQA